MAVSNFYTTWTSLLLLPNFLPVSGLGRKEGRTEGGHGQDKTERKQAFCL